MERGLEEVRVYVRLPAIERNAITDIEGYLVRAPTGAEVPLSQVALVTMGRRRSRRLAGCRHQVRIPHGRLGHSGIRGGTRWRDLPP